MPRPGSPAPPGRRGVCCGLGRRPGKLRRDGAPHLARSECLICCSVYSPSRAVVPPPRPAARGSLIKREGGATGPAAGTTRGRTERWPPGSGAGAAAGEGRRGEAGARDTSPGRSQGSGGRRAAGLPALRRHQSRAARRVPSPGLPLPTSPPAPLFLFVVATLRPGRPSPPAPLRSLPGRRGPPALASARPGGSAPGFRDVGRDAAAQPERGTGGGGEGWPVAAGDGGGAEGVYLPAVEPVLADIALDHEAVHVVRLPAHTVHGRRRRGRRGPTRSRHRPRCRGGSSCCSRGHRRRRSGHL